MSHVGALRRRDHGCQPFEHVIGGESVAKQFEWIIVQPSNASCAVTGMLHVDFSVVHNFKTPKAAEGR
jgi:hypothetical protein